jgi:hypothetical protein
MEGRKMAPIGRVAPHKQITSTVICALFGILPCSAPVYADWIVKSDVDLYKEPGGKGKPIGIVRGSQTKIYPAISCRSDNWCRIPGKGWVWGSFVEQVPSKGAGEDKQESSKPKPVGKSACDGPESVLWGDYCYKNQ